MNSKEYINYQKKVKEVVVEIARNFLRNNSYYQDEELLIEIIDNMHKSGIKLSDIKEGRYDSLIVTRYQEFKALTSKNK